MSGIPYQKYPETYDTLKDMMAVGDVVEDKRDREVRGRILEVRGDGVQVQWEGAEADGPEFLPPDDAEWLEFIGDT